MTNAQSMQAILPVITLLITGMVVLLGDAFLPFWRRSGVASGSLSLLGIVIAAGFALDRLSHQPTHSLAFHGALSLGRFTQACTLLLLLLAGLAVLLAVTYLENRRLNRGEYYTLVLFATSGAILMAAANDLIVLFIAVEMLSVALYVLAGFARSEPRSEEAALKYFLLGAFAAGFLLYGIALIYGGAAISGLGGTTNLALLHLRQGSVPGFMTVAGLALVLVGLGFKAALVPFHMWAPDVYEGSPTSVTGFMAVVVKVGAFAALMRLFIAFAPAAAYWLPAIQIIAVLTMVTGNLLAVTQTNVKRMLAYSSVAHAGYLLIAVAAAATPAAQPLALQAMVFYLAAYGLMTLGAFAVLAWLSHRDADCQTLSDLRGLVRTDPAAAWLMVIFMLSLGGIPPTMGFIGKWYLFTAALQSHQLWLAITLALVSMVAVFYYLRVVWTLCFEEGSGISVSRNTLAPAGVQISLYVAALLSLLGGIAPIVWQPLMLAARSLGRMP